MDQLKTIYNNIQLYQAGLPGFPRNFTRDGIISGMLMRDAEIIRNQILFSGSLQGTQADRYTGEEPGKIFHEYPGFDMNGLNTLFNACDTTALFIIGHEQYARLSGDHSLRTTEREKIENAAQYIRRHVKGGMFYEDPRLAGSDRFALKVTYWKDSELAQRKNGEPHYPVAYFLAHAMNLAGMRSAARMLGSDELFAAAEEMKQGLQRFYNAERKTFSLAIDAAGHIDGTSSDILHALFYLEPGDLTGEQVAAIHARASELETPLGYLTLAPTMQGEVADQYHASTVWPFEQAIINIGAQRFGLDEVARVSARIAQHLDTAPEIFIVKDHEFSKGGCDPQLWTIAAKKHFGTNTQVLLN